MEDAYAVKKLNRPVQWVTEVPGSKSITNRALLAAALSGGEVKLNGVLFSDDSRYFLSSLQSLGFPVEIREGQKQVMVAGCGGRIPRRSGEVYVGSAGTAGPVSDCHAGSGGGDLCDPGLSPDAETSHAAAV